MTVPVPVLIVGCARDSGRGSTLAVALDQLALASVLTIAAAASTPSKLDAVSVLVVADLEVCARVRAQADVAIAFITREGDAVAVRAFAAGADDVIDPSASAALIAARILALIRRATTVTRGRLTVGAVLIDRDASRVYRAGVDLQTTRTEYLLLHELVIHRGQARTREQLVDAVWGHRWQSRATRLVDIHIVGLRAKVGAGFIETVRGVGYRVDAELGVAQPRRRRHLGTARATEGPAVGVPR